MKDELLKKARDIDIQIVLAYYGIYPNQNNKYHCFYHTDNTASASVRLNRYKCFSCGRKNSNLDIVMYKENISDVREAAIKVLEISNSNVEIKNIEDKSNKVHNKKDRKALTLQDRLKLVNFDNTDKIVEYLKSRAIDPRVLKVLDLNNIKYGIDKLGQINFFFLKGNFCIYRSLSNKNFNSGTPVPVTIKVSDDNTWYITEGLFDALTFVDIGKNTICLNSVANVHKLMNMIDINNKKFTYIIATDSDEAGFRAMDELIDFFEVNRINYDVFDELYGSGCKDINEMRTKGLL